MKQILFIALLLPGLCTNAQKKPSQAEINKARQEQVKAQKEKDEELKELEEEDHETAKKIKEMRHKAQSIINSQGKSIGLDDDNDDENEPEDNLKMPPRKAALLASIPGKTMTRAEVSTYLAGLRSRLLQKMEPGKVQATKAAITQLRGDGNLLHEQGIALWYNGLKQEAALLLLEAAEKKKEDPLLLNNLAAFLNLGGAPNKAIPLLKHLLVSYPENPMLLNNLGQCYANLGEPDTAMYYLGRCIKISPLHAEANYTAGVIEATKGNKTKAESHFTNAAKTSPSLKHIEALKKINPEKQISSLLKPKFRAPGDFNPLKYQFPEQLEDALKIETVREQHEQFLNNLDKLIMQYNSLQDEEGQRGEELLSRRMAVVQKDPFSYGNRPETYLRPFTKTANLTVVYIAQDLVAQQADVHKYVGLLEQQIAAQKEKNKKDMELLEVEYNKRYANLPICGEGHCGSEELAKEFCSKRLNTINTSLKSIAALRRDMQQKQLSAALNEFENISYWGYFAGVNESFANANYYGAIIKYLSTIRNAAVTEYIYPPCGLPDDAIKEHPSEEKLAKAFCPFNITVAAAVIKLKLDCDKLSIQGGEGLRFKYEKSFSSGASSISIGVGLGYDDFSIGNSARTGITAEATEAIHISFDEENHFTDAGLEVTARISLEGKIAGEILKATERLELKAGYKIGINSSLTPNFTLTGNAFKLLN